MDDDGPSFEWARTFDSKTIEGESQVVYLETSLGKVDMVSRIDG